MVKKMICDDYMLDEREFLLFLNSDCLTEEDFYPPQDDRVLETYIDDIEGGDNFADYSEYIYRLYEQEEWYEN